MNMFRFAAISTVGFALSACSVVFPIKPADDPNDTARAVESAASSGKVVEQSLMRDGSRLSMVLNLPGQGDLFLQTDCAAGSADWLYADLVDQKSQPVAKVRRYGGGTSAYAEPLALAGEAATEIKRLPAVKAACERTPAWREVLYNKRNDTQVLLDISSLQPQADGSQRFWAAIDYPYLAYIRLYQAPYGRRAGLYQVDCQRQTYSLLFVYYLDQKQTVTDGGSAMRPPLLTFEQAPADTLPVLTTVCGEKGVLKTLVPPEVRPKQFPDFTAMPAPEAKIVDQVGQLRFAPPKYPLAAMRIEGTKAAKGGSAAMRLNSKAGVFVQEVSIETLRTPGVFHVIAQDGEDRLEQVSFLGMIPLSQTLDGPGSQYAYVVDRLELIGEWKTMPIGGQLSYKQRIRVVDLVTNQSNKEVEVICRVTREVSADGLNPRLQGTAKEIKCHTIGGRDDEIAAYYYLNQYGFAFLQGSASTKVSVNSRLVDFR